MDFGTVSGSFDALCSNYKNNENMVHSLVKGHFIQYKDKHGKTSIGMPILVMRCFSQLSNKEFSRPCCFSHLILMLFKRVIIQKKI